MAVVVADARMGRNYFLILVCITVAVGGYSDNSISGTTDYVDMKDYPYHVSVELQGRHLCGGTIIDDYWIVTVSSCLPDVDLTYLRVRTSTAEQGYHGSVYSVEKIVRFDRQAVYFKSTGKDGDLAMVKVSTSFRYGPSLSWLNLAQLSTTENATGIVTGWGGNEMFGDNLVRTQVKVMSDADCKKEFEGVMSVTEGIKCVTAVGRFNMNYVADIGAAVNINNQLAGIVRYRPNQGEVMPIAFNVMPQFGDYILITMSEIIPRS